VTAQWPASAPPAHDPDVPYRDEIAPAGAVDIACWDWWSHAAAATVHYYAKGPCPACQATTQGHYAVADAPIEGLGRSTDAAETGPAGPEELIEVPVRCHCGSDHGQPGAGGCGRRWSISGPRTMSSS
jgi:hypothetical protein